MCPSSLASQSWSCSCGGLWERGATLESATGLATGLRPLTGIKGTHGTPLLVCEEGTWLSVMSSNFLK